VTSHPAPNNNVGWVLFFPFGHDSLCAAGLGSDLIEVTTISTCWGNRQEHGPLFGHAGCRAIASGEHHISMEAALGLFSKDIETLDDLFVHTLQDIYYAEHQITKALLEQQRVVAAPDRHRINHSPLSQAI
jgi:hypothetical protein